VKGKGKGKGKGVEGKGKGKGKGIKGKGKGKGVAAWSKCPRGSARLLCLLRARLVAPRGLRHPEREHSQLSQPPPKPPILPPLAI
tara:strand:- start:175 stop:429 length:255 start_codon:yes stop_codon:yes gene_type:complete